MANIEHTSVHIINSLSSAADAYIACAADDPLKGQLFEAVEEWMAATFEADGYTKAQLDQMDIRSATHDYIAQRRARRT